MIAVGFDKFSAGGKAGQMFEEQSAVAATAQSQLAHQLLVARALTRRTLNPAKQFAIAFRRAGGRLGRLESGARQSLWYRL
jgi:hypothetical protein